MHILDQQLTVELTEDEANVNMIIQDGDFKQHLSALEVVDLIPSPTGYPVRREWTVGLDLGVHPSPTATFKVLPRKHSFKVPRPIGLRPVRFRGYIEVRPIVKYGDERYTDEGAVPPNFSAMPAIRSLSRWLANITARLTRRLGG